ncbi:hypothetical protein [Lichenicoccus sp.]|uniref:hypothetical protein n=1 Tax=Lichenicoccus sp. TaxID=2781899 RepID=UPI003D10ECA6
MLQQAVPRPSSTPRAAQVALQARSSAAGLAKRQSTNPHPEEVVLAESGLRAAIARGMPGVIARQRLPQLGAVLTATPADRPARARANATQTRRIVPSGRGTGRGLDRAYAAPPGTGRSDTWMSAAGSRTDAGKPEAVAAAARQVAALTGAKGVPRRAPAPDAGAWTSLPRHEVGAVTSSGRREAASQRYPGSPAAQSAERLAGGFAGSGQGDTTIALTGDIIIDGRKLGRIAAATQVSGASLPPRSASAVNIKALPIFTGSSVPL